MSAGDGRKVQRADPHVARRRLLGGQRTERGNTLFIVVMVITLMTAIGMYSMRAASLAEQASGFNRMGVQTSYLSEFAARSTMTELIGKEQHYFRYIAAGNDDCRANRELATFMSPDRPPCYRLESQELWARFDAAFPGNMGSSEAPQLFGELSRAETEGAFIVEMTDLARVGGPVVGEDVAMDQFKFMQVLMTATAQVRPRLAADGSEEEEEEETSSICNDSLSATSGLQSLRAQITFGPVN
jgi:hypothetical protein